MIVWKLLSQSYAHSCEILDKRQHAWNNEDGDPNREFYVNGISFYRCVMDFGSKAKTSPRLLEWQGLCKSMEYSNTLQ